MVFVATEKSEQVVQIWSWRAMRRPISRASVTTAASIRASVPPLSFAATPLMTEIPRSSLSGISQQLPQQYAPGSRFGPAILPCQTGQVGDILHGIIHLSSSGGARGDMRCLACD